MIADMHVHTNFSCDSKQTMDEYCLYAIEKNVSVICFTEHIDYNPNNYGYGYYNGYAYFNEIKSCQDKYSDKIKILSGVEFSEPHIYKKRI